MDNNLQIIYFNFCFKGLNGCGIECDYLYGQGYDGASNMAGKFNGVQAVIRATHPKALYVHCAAHSFNLAVCTSSNIQSVRNCLGIVERLYVFFNTPKRKNALINEIEKSDSIPNSNARTLKRQCATRWVQKYESLNDFVELLLFVVKTLETIYSTWGVPSSVDANVLLKSLLDSEFLVSLYVTKVNF